MDIFSNQFLIVPVWYDKMSFIAGKFAIHVKKTAFHAEAVENQFLDS